jgi:mannose-6-phosphate isomerase
LPSGTLHALGAGIVVAEVQNPSDTTFRVFDWGRKDRDLHVAQAMQCIHFGPCDARQFEHRSESVRDGVRRTELVQCAEFRWTRVQVERDSEFELPAGRALVWMVLAGAGSIGGASFEPVALRRAQTLLLPTALAAARVRAKAGTSWLEISFPSESG